MSAYPVWGFSVYGVFMPRPSLYPKPCAHPTCSRVTRTRYCELHTVEAAVRDRQRGTAAQRGYDYRWQQLRTDHLARYPMCNAPGCIRRATLVDHIIPLSEGGSNHPSNLQSLCQPHHASKTKRESDARRAVKVMM